MNSSNPTKTTPDGKKLWWQLLLDVPKIFYYSLAALSLLFGGPEIFGSISDANKPKAREEMPQKADQDSALTVRNTPVVDVSGSIVMYSHCSRNDRGKKPEARCSAAVQASVAGHNHVLLDTDDAQYYNPGGHYQNPSKKESVYDDGGYLVGLKRHESCHRARSLTRNKSCTARAVMAAVAVPRDKHDKILGLVNDGRVHLKCHLEIRSDSDNYLSCNWGGTEYAPAPIRYKHTVTSKVMRRATP